MASSDRAKWPQCQPKGLSAHLRSQHFLVLFPVSLCPPLPPPPLSMSPLYSPDSIAERCLLTSEVAWHSRVGTREWAKTLAWLSHGGLCSTLVLPCPVPRDRRAWKTSVAYSLQSECVHSQPGRQRWPFVRLLLFFHSHPVPNKPLWSSLSTRSLSHTVSFWGNHLRGSNEAGLILTLLWLCDLEPFISAMGII